MAELATISESRAFFDEKIMSIMAIECNRDAALNKTELLCGQEGIYIRRWPIERPLQKETELVGAKWSDSTGRKQEEKRRKMCANATGVG